LTVPSQVVLNPRISAGSTVGVTGPASALTRVSSKRKERGYVNASSSTSVQFDIRSHINVRLQPQRLMIPLAAVGCKPVLGSV